jgi:hypothetical protein
MVGAAVFLFTSIERSNAGPPATPRSKVIAAGHEDGYLAAKQRYEDCWQEKLERAVGFIPGIVVVVDVTLSPEEVYREESIEYAEKPIPSKTKTMVTQVGKSEAVISVNPSSDVETEETNEETVINVPPSVERTIQHASFVPEAVTVAITAPRGHLRRIAISRGQTKEFSQQQLEQLETQLTTDIERIVVALIPKAPPGEDTFPRVTVVWHDEPGQSTEYAGHPTAGP